MFGPKAGGAWPAGTSLIGPQGPQGIQGAQGIQGPQGIQGAPGADGNTVLYGAADPTAGQGVNGNFYINTTSHFLFGPKAGGAWPAGTSLVGPQGPQGPAGPSGGGGAASGVTFAPTGNVASTNVQAAIAEVDSEKVAKAGDTMTGPLTTGGNFTLSQQNKSIGKQRRVRCC